MLDGKLQGFDADAVPRVGGDFESTQAMDLQHLQRAKIGGRLDRHDIARFADRVQTVIDGFRPTRSDQYIRRGKAAAGAHHPPRNLDPQRVQTGREMILVYLLTVLADQFCNCVIEGLDETLVQVRQRRAELDQFRVVRIAHEHHDQLVQADQAGIPLRR